MYKSTIVSSEGSPIISTYIFSSAATFTSISSSTKKLPSTGGGVGVMYLTWVRFCLGGVC